MPYSLMAESLDHRHRNVTAINDKRKILFTVDPNSRTVIKNTISTADDLSQTGQAKARDKGRSHASNADKDDQDKIAACSKIEAAAENIRDTLKRDCEQGAERVLAGNGSAGKMRELLAKLEKKMQELKEAMQTPALRATNKFFSAPVDSKGNKVSRTYAEIEGDFIEFQRAYDILKSSIEETATTLAMLENYQAKQKESVAVLEKAGLKMLPEQWHRIPDGSNADVIRSFRSRLFIGVAQILAQASKEGREGLSSEQMRKVSAIVTELNTLTDKLLSIETAIFDRPEASDRGSITGMDQRLKADLEGPNAAAVARASQNNNNNNNNNNDNDTSSNNNNNNIIINGP